MFTSGGSGLGKGGELLSFELGKVTFGAFVQGDLVLNTQIPCHGEMGSSGGAGAESYSLCACGRNPCWCKRWGLTNKSCLSTAGWGQSG